MDRRVFSAMVGLIPAGLWGLATQVGELLVPVVATGAAAVVAAGIHLAWKANVRQA